MRRNFLKTLGALVCVPMLHGCGAALGWVGAVTGAIEMARALVAQVTKWFGPGGTYRDIPGVPVDVYSEIDAVTADVLEILAKAEAATKKGAEFQQAAQELYLAARVLLVERLLKRLGELGWFNAQSNQLVEPAASRASRADGTAEPAQVMAVQLPPERLE